MITSVGIVGNFNIDIIIGKVQYPPKWDTEILATSYHPRVAGTAGYMAEALKGLGIPPVIISAIGNDDYADFLINYLTKNKFETGGITKINNQQTPVGYVIVHEDGSRAIISVSGAHDEFDIQKYEDKKELLQNCEEIVICGTYLLPKFGFDEALEVVKEQKKNGKKIYFDPSWDPDGWKEETKNKTFELLEYVDVYLPNETEICHVTGEDHWEKAMKVISQYCKGEIIIKLGSKGAAALKDGQLTYVEGKQVEVVDTTGAGDIFNIGYLYASRKGYAIKDRLEFANNLASTIISQKIRKFPSFFGEI